MSFFLFILLVILQIVDSALTIQALKNPKLKESNVFLKKIMDKIGVVPTLVLTKVGALSIIYYYLPVMPLAALVGLVVLYFVVILNNIYQLKFKA